MRYLLAGVATLGIALSVAAAVPTFWRLESQTDFLAGDTDGVSIDSDGRITLAPVAQVLYEATEPHFWSLVVAPSGAVFVGSGNDGKIYEIDPQGNERLVADMEELQVHALAADRQGRIYAGTSPRGAVYRIEPDGTHDVFFDPDERYIWALAFDSAGRLHVATGDAARVYRVTSSGEGEVLFSSEETHIVSLIVDANDRLFAGTDPNGLVLSVDPNGTTSVLFDTPFQEVRALVSDTRGNVFAATVNGGTRAAPPEAPTPAGFPTPDPLAAAAGGVAVTVTAFADTNVIPPGPAPSASSQAGGLYRIDSEGAADLLWQSSENTPLSLSLARDDRLMIGTGNAGRIFLVAQDQTSSLLTSVEADQVTAIRAGSEGQSFLATSNPAKLYRLNPGRRTEGTYLSPTKDTGTVSSWGKIRWESRAPAGTGVGVQTRTGNSNEPDNTWSDWSPAYQTAEGEQITSPRARFIQWRAVLNSTGEVTPELHNLTAIYLQQNLAPQVTEITLHPPGQIFQKPLATSGQIEILGMEDSLADESSYANGGGAPNPAMVSAMNAMAYARPLFRKGIQTVTWKASDPNEDELRYDVLYRAEGESFWRPLRAGLTNAVIAWDTVAMPDGRYTLRIVARDAASNPSDMAKSGEKTSKSFEVDNTPPRVEGLAAQAEGGGHRIAFVAVDDTSPIQAAEYAVNSGRWSVVFPTDGVSDSPRERFDFTLDGYRDGVYTLVVKVTDTLGNTATARVELR
ncbi:MAG TPA: hypothetical protein VLK65_02530 [Vicinamibacteria bacterium]|nr:hypothetical protein [Vicinamibacteria bacterium]